MKLRYKITGGIFAFLLLLISIAGITLSYSSDCKPAPTFSSDTELMKAITYRCYGSADVVEFSVLEKPTPNDNEVLIKIQAASVNPMDWHFVKGTPYLLRIMTGIGAPEFTGLGVDYAGTVTLVGKNVTRFKPGDEVFGNNNGAFAEYISMPENGNLSLKPTDVSFLQASTIPVAGVTALQALRDHGQIKPGQKVLINGASGGVGTFAVQIAKSFGAEVTGVSSKRNHQMVRSIGADHVINYKEEDYTEGGAQYDLIIDTVGNHSMSKNAQALKRDGKLVMIAGEKGNWIAPLIRPIQAEFFAPSESQQFITVFATINKEDLAFIAELMQAGKVKSVTDRVYQLSEVADALRYSEQGRARGKIVINMQ